MFGGYAFCKLGYHADSLQQRRITAMLNKGETTNTLDHNRTIPAPGNPG
jgi:hypothetical protein